MIKLKLRVSKGVLIACGVVVVLLFTGFLVWIYWPWVFFPTTSSRHELTITNDGWGSRTRPIVTISHYVNGMHAAKYILTIENGVSHLERQSYRLPRFDEGTVEVKVEFGTGPTGVGPPIDFTLVYENASDLYEGGLLIHITGNNGERIWINGTGYDDHHVYFMSGEREQVYFRKANTSEWLSISDAPPLERVLRKGPPPGDTVFYSGWREYEWTVVYADSSAPE